MKVINVLTDSVFFENFAYLKHTVIFENGLVKTYWSKVK